MSKYLPQHFISYGDQNFYNSIRRIENEAKKFNTFSSINTYKDNSFYDNEFKQKFNYVLSHSKGSGYWIWKFFLINKKFQEINDGEFIIYCDAGCTINESGKKRYYEYLDLLNNSEYGILSFPLNSSCVENHWTIKEIFNYFNIDVTSDIAKSPQLCATVLIIKKNEHSKKILEEYSKILEYDQKLITDYYNNNNQHSFFKDARQDQSIWSIIRKIFGSLMVDVDESFEFYFNEKGNKFEYPFWATRIKN